MFDARRRSKQHPGPTVSSLPSSSPAPQAPPVSAEALTMTRTTSDGPPKLSVVTAKDYVPGKEYNLLRGVQTLLVSSNKLVGQSAKKAPRYPWEYDAEEEMKTKRIEALDMDGPLVFGTDEGNLKKVTSGDYNPNEMDGIVESMSFVVETMRNYQTKASQAAKDFVQEQQLAAKTDQADKDKGMWNLGEIAKDMNQAEFFLGSLMPNQSSDVYPEGSKPILPKKTVFSPTTDMFLGSITSMFGMKTDAPQVHNGNLLKNKAHMDEQDMDSKIKYLEDVQAVKAVCQSQLRELDTILSNQGLVVEDDLVEDTCMENGLSMEANLEGAVARKPFQAMDTHNVFSYDGSLNNNSMITRDVEDKARAAPINTTAISYIQAARNQLKQYAEQINKILTFEVKCMVEEQGSAMESKKEDGGMYFDALRKHLGGDAYNLGFETYLMEEQDKKMQTEVLNCLHNSLFLRNVVEKCKHSIRLRVGKELSVSVCNVIMDSILNSKKNRRISEWGACLFKRHALALHTYVYEFCRSEEGADEDLMERVLKSNLDAEPLGPSWERLFWALDILKLEYLEEYNDALLHPLFGTHDVRSILRLRTEFNDRDIDNRLDSQKKARAASKTVFQKQEQEDLIDDTASRKSIQDLVDDTASRTSIQKQEQKEEASNSVPQNQTYKSLVKDMALRNAAQQKEALNSVFQKQAYKDIVDDMASRSMCSRKNSLQTQEENKIVEERDDTQSKISDSRSTASTSIPPREADTSSTASTSMPSREADASSTVSTSTPTPAREADTKKNTVLGQTKMLLSFRPSSKGRTRVRSWSSRKKREKDEASIDEDMLLG